jgi:methionine-rich copper-binding protein CopC
MRTLICTAMLTLTTSFAFAHSQLTASTPADQSSVERAPSELVLRFSEPVRLTALTIARAGGADRELAPLPAQRMRDFTVASPELELGRYTVSWRALSQDSHVMSGSFTFAIVQPGVASGASDESSAARPDHGTHPGAHDPSHRD